MQSRMPPLMLLWRYVLAPLLYPILSAPLLLIGAVLKPTQTVLVLVTTGLLFAHWGIALAFVIGVSLLYSYYVLVPPQDARQYIQWATTYPVAPGGGWAPIVFTVGLLVVFFVSMLLLPSFQPVLRWLLAVGIGYYCSSVAMAYVVVWTTDPIEATLLRPAAASPAAERQPTALPPLRVSADQLDRVIAHCRRELPHMACGVIAGVGETAMSVYEAENAEQSPYRYAIAPAQLLRIYGDIQKNGWKVIAIYSSRPSGEGYPSTTDIRMAESPDAFYVYVSVKSGETRVFRIAAGAVSEHELVVD